MKFCENTNLMYVCLPQSSRQAFRSATHDTSSHMFWKFLEYQSCPLRIFYTKNKKQLYISVANYCRTKIIKVKLPLLLHHAMKRDRCKTHILRHKHLTDSDQLTFWLVYPNRYEGNCFLVVCQNTSNTFLQINVGYGLRLGLCIPKYQQWFWSYS